MNKKTQPAIDHAFIVRIWWELGSVDLDGRRVWRGRVQHAASGDYLVFCSLDELVSYIESWMGEPAKNLGGTR